MLYLSQPKAQLDKPDTSVCLRIVLHKCVINQRDRASAVSSATATNRPVNKWFFADLLMF